MLFPINLPFKEISPPTKTFLFMETSVNAVMTLLTITEEPRKFNTPPAEISTVVEAPLVILIALFLPIFVTAVELDPFAKFTVPEDVEPLTILTVPVWKDPLAKFTVVALGLLLELAIFTVPPTIESPKLSEPAPPVLGLR